MYPQQRCKISFKIQENWKIGIEKSESKTRLLSQTLLQEHLLLRSPVHGNGLLMLKSWHTPLSMHRAAIVVGRNRVVGLLIHPIFVSPTWGSHHNTNMHQEISEDYVDGVIKNFLVFRGSRKEENMNI